MSLLYTYSTESITTLSTTVMRRVVDQLQDAGFLTYKQAEEIKDTCIVVVKELPWWKRFWIKMFPEELDNTDDRNLGIMVMRRLGSESSNLDKSEDKSEQE
jgi:hypothetical protein